MKVTLFIPCFINLFYPKVGMSMIQILERLGHEVDFKEDQTCCGQPPFNAGYWDEARAAAFKNLERYRESEVVVIPSGSCGAMMKVFYPQLFDQTPYRQEALDLSAKTFEFSDFLVNRLGVTDLGARLEGTATFHDGCHGLRELGIKTAPRQLLAKVKGLQLIEMSEAERCCGFGGLFAVKFPSISTAMDEVKCDSIQATKADYVVSNDSSCLMQIQGLLQRQGRQPHCVHLAEVLAQQ